MSLLDKYCYKLKHRRVAQIGSLIINNSYFFPFMKVCPTAGMNCYACPLAIGACPIGSVEHFMVLRQIPFFMMGFFAFIGGILGRAVCGWFCPVGWFQELLYKIPTRKWQLRFKPLRYLKYVILVTLVLLIPFITGDPWFSKVCFIGTIEGGIPLATYDKDIQGLIGTFFYTKLAMTVGLIVLFIFVQRAFCRYLCPLGAIYSLFNKVSFFRLEVEHTCTHCNRCQQSCPMDLKVYENANSPECIRCLECTACPSVKVCAGKKQVKSIKEKGVEVHA